MVPKRPFLRLRLFHVREFLANAVRHALGVEADLFVQKRHLALADEAVGNAERQHGRYLRGRIGRQRLEDPLADAAFDHALFGRGHQQALLGGGAYRVFVERLNPTHIDHANRDAFFGQNIGRAFCFLHHTPEGENGHIASFARRTRFAHFEHLRLLGQFDPGNAR